MVFFLPSHCALRARVRGLCVFILCLVAKNEARKHAKGQALWKPAPPQAAPASRFDAPLTLRKARLGGVVWQNFAFTA